MVKTSKTRSGLRFVDFVKQIDGKSVELFVLSNENGLEACFTNFGQRLVSLLVPDKNGVFNDVVLGHNSLEEYVHPENEHYFGAIVGRHANRIHKGSFELEGRQYSLAINNPPNHLHGGANGFHKVVWEASQISASEISFTYVSKHLEEGYPGNLSISVNYLLNDQNELIITYKAATDQPTIINLTHHSYFNLKGEGKGTIEDHILTINADHFTPVDEYMIPNGIILPVIGTPFDFTSSKAIGKEIDQDYLHLKTAKGYDCNFVLNKNLQNKEGLYIVARVEEPNTGRIIEVFTSEPGLQLYSGNFLNGTTKGKKNTPHQFREGLCLETQHFPDSPNQANFPKTILRQGDHFLSKTIYKFSTSA